MKRDVRFKVMPNGNIRAFRINTKDLAGASEWMIAAPPNESGTITTAHTPLIYITYEN